MAQTAAVARVRGGSPTPLLENTDSHCVPAFLRRVTLNSLGMSEAVGI